MSKLGNNTKNFVAGLTGAAGSIAAISAVLITIFNWPADKVTAVVSIVIGLIFCVGYGLGRMVNRINRGLDERLENIKETIEENERAAQERAHARDLSLCRLELSDLMNNDPDNTVAIRKKARHYFCELNGNEYMSERYSHWANEYDNGDLSILSCDLEK